MGCHAPERRLNVRFISERPSFAPVGDILEAVGEQDRCDFRYRHLAFAIRADSIVGTTERVSLVLITFPFAPTNVGASKQVYPPGLG
jgi:hypothetical protein